MESNELRIFIVVAQEGSITKATQILGYVQSNVTARIQQLDSIIEGVISDLGASFVPQSAIERYEERGLIKSFPVPNRFSSTKTYFIRHKDSLKTSALTKFIEMIELKTPYKTLLHTQM